MTAEQNLSHPTTNESASSQSVQNSTQSPDHESLLEIIETLQTSEAIALEDRDLADRECRRLRLEAARLRKELQDVREADPKSQLIREVCDYWVKTLGKTKRTKTPTNGARWIKVRARLNDNFTAADLKKAIDGCALMPFVGPHGRQPTETSGAKRHDDLELICRDETTVERFIGYFDDHNKPTPEPEREPESIARQFVRHVYAEDCELPYRPASQEPRRRPAAPGAPIDKILGALHALGCQVVAYQAHNDQWSAQCPAHEDRNPSLSIHRKPDGTILLNCWASCTNAEVIHALGLEWRDLWEESERDLGRLNGRPDPTIPGHLQTAMRQLLERAA